MTIPNFVAILTHLFGFQPAPRERFSPRRRFERAGFRESRCVPG